jgi:hypothetical protein
LAQKDWNTSTPEQINITSEASFREVKYLEFKSLECKYSIFISRSFSYSSNLTEASYSEEAVGGCVQVAVNSS